MDHFINREKITELKKHIRISLKNNYDCNENSYNKFIKEKKIILMIAMNSENNFIDIHIFVLILFTF